MIIAVKANGRTVTGMDEFREVTKMIMSEIDKDINVPNKNDSISRQAALDALKDSRFPGAPYVDAGMSIAIGVICDLPSADAVPVVRCKDCRYGHRFFDVINGTTDNWIECRNPDGLNRDTSEDSFCSYGER